MQDVRCRCGKIVCQVDNLDTMPRMVSRPPDPQAPAIVILCRHCKATVTITVPSILALSGAAPTARPALQLQT